jgi:serine protease AprX
MLAALALDNETAKASDYLVVQTHGPLNADQRSALAKVGAEILEAVPGDAFICYFPKTNLTKVRALDFVTWAELYPRAVKIAPSLRKLDAPPGGVGLMAAALAVHRVRSIPPRRLWTWCYIGMRTRRKPQSESRRPLT